MYVCLKGDLKRLEDVDKRLVNFMRFNILKESVE